MTAVVCAGDDYLCNGLYKGIASDAELVLIKVQDEAGRITTANIVKALHWVLKNNDQYNIKIINMSLGEMKSILTGKVKLIFFVRRIDCQRH